MNRFILFPSILILLWSCARSQSPVTEVSAETLRLGAERMEEYLPLLEDKRVALLVNHTSLVGDRHLADTLLSSNVTIAKVFAPEHGFRGNAADGEKIKDGKDPATQLPIVSLYGNNRKPTPEQLADVDVVIFDIQDVGTRFYTYISSMHYLMEACAEQNKEVIVLDRPNPNGRYIDGPIMEEDFRSFVGMHPIPILHGMTVGELARMINGENWMDEGVHCNLTVISMENYSHDMEYSLPVNPSPNLPNDLSVKLYPSLCLFEGTQISVGRGTMQPFQQIGHPALTMFNHSFTPVSIEGMSKYPPLENEKCFGTLFTTESEIDGLDLSVLLEYYSLFPEKDKFFKPYFENLVGTATLRAQIREGISQDEIKETWKNGLNTFRVQRKPYLLYP